MIRANGRIVEAPVRTHVEENMSLKPICMPCHRFFKPEKNGFVFTEGMPVGDARPMSGNAEPEKWKPYKIWCGDVWKCNGCGALIIVGVAGSPRSEHYREDFASIHEETGANKFQVNDC